MTRCPSRPIRPRLSLTPAEVLTLRSLLGELALAHGDDRERLAVVERVEAALGVAFARRPS